MAEATVTLDGMKPGLLLCNAPLCQYLERLDNKEICFVRREDHYRYVRHLSSLQPKHCDRGTQLGEIAVRRLQPGEFIRIEIDGLGPGQET